MPAYGAGVRVQGQHRAGKKIVAGSDIAIPVRRRIARGPVQRIQLGIERTCEPGRTTTGLPGITEPGFAAGLPRLWHGKGSPQAFTAVRIIGVDECAYAGLGAADTDDDLAIQCQGGQRQRKTRGIIRYRGFPAHRTGAGIEGEQTCVQRGNIDRIIEYGDAAIDSRKTDIQYFIGQIR